MAAAAETRTSHRVTRVRVAPAPAPRSLSHQVRDSSLLLHPLPTLQLRHRADGIVLLLRHLPANICGREEVQHHLAALPIDQEVPYLPPILPPPSLLLHLHPQDLLLWLPLGALLEKIVLGLRLVLAPPALRCGLVLCPVEVLPSQTVPCLELVELRGKPLSASYYCAIRLLAFQHLIFPLGGPAPCPQAHFCPLLLRDLLLEIGKGPQEWHRPCFCSVQVAQPFYPAGVWLLCSDVCPLVSLLIAGDPLVSRAPSDFDDNT